tara:strand:+ start:17797 stop:20175 length:2379 start_codon:yes stop_codon:yes gene_type:complete
MRKPLLFACCLALVSSICELDIGIAAAKAPNDESTSAKTEFFERRIRPLLVQHCYECHSEESGEQQGGLLLDRESGWIDGGEMGKAVLPGELAGSLLITAIRYDDDELQMPPDGPLDPEVIKTFEKWIEMGAPGPAEDLGESEFSRLGDQDYLFGKAEEHWAFQPVRRSIPPVAADDRWNTHAIDQFIYSRLDQEGLSPSTAAPPETIVRRLYFGLTGLPPTYQQVQAFVHRYEKDPDATVREQAGRLINSPGFGQHVGRMWLDVARYADTDSAYRPDTKSPYYFPFAFTYRDYVIDAFNADKPFDVFVREQLAADLMGYSSADPEIAALGFLGIAPHANRSQAESMDDWIDVTSRGLMGVSVACARCHDHKFEPIPTADYYSLRGVFASMQRFNSLDEKRHPVVQNYQPTDAEIADYQAKRAAIDKKIADAEGKMSNNNRRSIAGRIRDTELAELLTFHPGAPARAMIVRDTPKPARSFVLIRGDANARGEEVPRRFLKVLDPDQPEFSDQSSGRLELAEKITHPDNPLTARLIVNRIWGLLIGSHLVDTPSDLGLQGSPPSHPELLDWLADDFVTHGWSIKRLAKQIVCSQTFLQSSDHRDQAAEIDPQNRLLWRANRKHLTIEMLRDSILAVSGQMDPTPGGRSEPFWGDDYTRRRAIYGFINRFNLDPTLRAFDFPTPMQSQPARGESIVAQQSLFTLNSQFVVEQTKALTDTTAFQALPTDEQKIEHLFTAILQREPAVAEVNRIAKFIEFQARFDPSDDRNARFLISPWPLIAQSLLMCNEFQYID